MTIIKMNQEYDKIVLDAQDKKLAEVMFLMSDIMKNGHGRLVSAASFGVIELPLRLILTTFGKFITYFICSVTLMNEKRNLDTTGIHGSKCK